MKKLLLLFTLVVGCGFMIPARAVTDVFVSDMITNEAFQDISYLSPQSGVSYLSSLYTFEDEIVFQDDRNNMRTAIAGSSADGLVLESIEIGWHPNPLESNVGRTIVVYAKDEPYASSLDVYDSELRGVEIGRATYPETTLTVAPGHSNIVVMAELDRFGLVELNALSFNWKSQGITDVFVSEMITNEAFQDISYLSPQTGVSYLSSLYTFEDEIVFQDDRNNMRTAIAGSSADGLVLESIEIGWHPNPLESNVGRTIVVYAKDEPYASSLDVYDSELRGVEIGRATYPETTLTVAPGHSNIVVMAELDRFGLVELNALSFNWAGEMKQAIEPLSITTNSGLAVADRSKLNIFEPTTITITTSTPGVEFEWSMGTKSGTSKDALSLEIAEDGVLNVTATKEGYNSRTFECTFVYYAPVTSIQNYWNRYTLYDEGINDEFTVQFESTVVYAANVLGDGQVIITDGTNFARVYFEGREVD
ncbi:MAG: hypothetical protein K2L74_07095, partial [Muribaculaceae bacterium]|nr:hypothetical protein [Muribaculaceae bacterium]